MQTVHAGDIIELVLLLPVIRFYKSDWLFPQQRLKVKNVTETPKIQKFLKLQKCTQTLTHNTSL